MSRRQRTNPKPTPAPPPDAAPAAVPSTPQSPTQRQKLLLAGAITLGIFWIAALILACLHVNA